MEKSDSNIGLFFCSHSRPNSSEGSAKESRRAGTAEYVTKDERRIKRTPQFKFQNPKIKNQKFFWKLKKKLYLCPKLTLQ